MPTTLRRLPNRGRDCRGLKPVECGLEALIGAGADAAADEGQDFIGRCRHQARRLEASITRVDDLGGRPDQNVGIPDGRHAMFGDGLDADRNRTRPEVDRGQASGLGEGEKGVGHEVLRIAGSEVAGQRAEQIELFMRQAFTMPPRHAPARAAWRLAGRTVPTPGWEVELLAPMSAQAWRSSSA